MTPKNLIILALVALAAGVCIYNLTDWFRPPVIQIIPSVRPVLGPDQAGEALPVTFTMNADYRMTSLRVVPVADVLKENKNPHCLWHLTTVSNSEPTRGFGYGMAIPGMKPADPKAPLENLKADVLYRIYIEAGRAKGFVDFKTRPAG
ncbi:MAG TPA: hypothetical protein VHH73_13635 [Verrucomicrobiae bacterium]|nr:hypothetical protein [Verrucomicrobiae bacterium]